jgi:serine/threonine protein kinase
LRYIIDFENMEDSVFLTQQAIHHCHSNEIAHGDIKTSNILYTSKPLEFVLSDFGLAWKIQFEVGKMPFGTPPFMAPEVLREDEGSYYLMDMWSVGVVLLTKVIAIVRYQRFR